MAIFLLPAVGWAAVVLIAGATGFTVYQLKYIVEDVSEVFTNEDSVLNSGIIQIGLAAVALYIASKYVR